MIRLDADQILYIESRGHTIIYHTEIGEVCRERITEKRRGKARAEALL